MQKPPTFEQVLKFNPYHDKAGRFSSGSAGPIKPIPQNRSFISGPIRRVPNSPPPPVRRIPHLKALGSSVRRLRPGALSVPEQFKLSDAEKQRNYQIMFGRPPKR